jgi:hypothetical protein
VSRSEISSATSSSPVVVSDASSKAGLLDYNLNWHSDFDECLEVRDVVVGQYCSVRVNDMVEVVLCSRLVLIDNF